MTASSPSCWAGDAEAMEVVFEASIAEVIERHVADERLRTALHGQGIIGTYAGPRDRGTAAVHLLHASGTLEGDPGAWGYVEGGMGRVSFALADAATDAGAVIATGVGVATIAPGEGVRLEGGELVRCRVVVSNADPKRTLALCQAPVPDGFGARVAAWRTDSPVVKVNCGLRRLPRFPAAGTGTGTGAGTSGADPTRAMVTISTGTDATQQACERSRRGEPAPAWCELYFHTAYDPSVAPDGRHAMSVFAQYAPYRLAAGTWDDRREEIGDLVIERDRPLRPGTWPTRSKSARCSARRTSRIASGSLVATSSRGNACRNSCGHAASPPARRCPAFTCAGRRRIRAAASSVSTGATPPWPCSRT